VRRSAIGIFVLVVLTLVGRSTAQDFAFDLKGADVAFAERNYDVARTLYERAIREGASLENDLPHARSLVTTYLNANPPETAKTIQWLQVVVRLDPQADGLRLQLCKLLMNTGDTGSAVQQYKQLVEKHPQSSEYVLALAYALRQDGRSDAALRLLKETVEHYPNLNTVRVEYARALNFVREFSEARRQFSKVLDYDPNDLIAQVGMAKSMSYDGDQEGALVEYDRILKMHPGLYDAMIGKAFALLWSGRMDEAREYLQKGLSRHPDDREVREALASLPKGNGSSPNMAATSVAAPAPMVIASVPAPIDTHLPAAATLMMPPRSIVAPKAKGSHAMNSKGNKAAAVSENPATTAETDVPREPATAGSGATVTVLYVALTVTIALLAFAGLKLRKVQAARKFEAKAAAHAVGVSDFVASAVGPDGSAMIVTGRSRKLSDLFAPINQRKPQSVVIENSTEVAAPIREPEIVRPAQVTRFQEPATAIEMPICEPISPVENFADVIPIAATVELPLAPEMSVSVGPLEETIPTQKPLLVTSDANAPVEPLQPIHVRMNVTEVLIVGGLTSVVQLQLRWLGSQIHDLKPVLERDWVAAATKIAKAPPAVIILNSGSDDRWTSMRMFSWIVANHPELRRRVIAVTTADHYPTESDDLVICEPIDAREWQKKVIAAIEASKSDVNLATLHSAARFAPNLRGAAAH
jgi:Flp pilus assembly protein TadD